MGSFELLEICKDTKIISVDVDLFMNYNKVKALPADAAWSSYLRYEPLNKLLLESLFDDF